MLSWLKIRWERFARNRSGNVAIIVALAAVPIIGMTGLAVDYGFMLSLKAKLDQAADAAALAGVTQTKAYVLAYQGTGDPTAAAIASGQAQAQAQFNANTGKLPNGTLTINSLTVTRSGTTLTSNISYSFSMPTFFMAVLGTKTMTFSGHSNSTVTMATYVNVYVVLDVSSSMGIGATASDQQIVYNSTGGCAVACHYSGTTTTARAAGATLRIDVAKQSIVAGLNNIPTNATYQVAVYTMSDKFTQVSALSSNVSSAISAVNNIDLAGDNDDGGTDTTNALKTLASQLPTSGNGLTRSTAQGVVMLITDGVQDSDMKVYSQGNYVDQNDPIFTVFTPCNQSSCEFDTNFGVYFEAFDPTQCAPIKSAGYTMMTLEVQYLIPPTNLQGGNAALQGAFSYIQNYLLNSIPTNMSACASSPSYSYSGNTPSQIAAATKAMFGAIPMATQTRLSQ